MHTVCCMYSLLHRDSLLYILTFTRIDMSFAFPAFRSEEWIRSLLVYCHPDVLSGVDLTPKYMEASPSAGLYISKANGAKEQIRRTLFRHAIFKIQNVEVTDRSCTTDRYLTSVNASPAGPAQRVRSALIDLWTDNSSRLISEEIWNIDRCGSNRPYYVRYYREGDDGFSTRVVPQKVSDIFGMLRFYFS